MDRTLTPEGQADRDDFEREYGTEGNCSCHLSPPCGSCMYPGNPRNQEEDDTCWVRSPLEDVGSSDEDIPEPLPPSWLRKWIPQLVSDDTKLDDDHPLACVNDQILGLLEGIGASEDHEDVVAFLTKTGLPPGTVAKMHRAIAEHFSLTQRLGDTQL